MAKYIINGGKKLNGTVNVQGAKNSVLPLLAAALLTDETTVLQGCPNLIDITNMSRILQTLGADVSFGDNLVTISSKNLLSHEIPCRLAREIRGSIFLLGSVLGRMGVAKVAYPGGCDIGKRPIDIHIKALNELGVKTTEKYGYVYCDAKDMHAENITLSYPSVGATENVMLLTACLSGVTTLNNAAKEPEIEDLQNFLNAMGAKIEGAGTSQIKITGVKKLSGTQFKVMPDRIAAGTYLLACAATGGEITLTNVNPSHISALLNVLYGAGFNICEGENQLTIASSGGFGGFGLIQTEPHPGFPTDLQAQISTLACVANGESVINENIFETRFKHIPELIKMGAQIDVNDKTATIRGVPFLTGAEVAAGDLRGGASLVIAGLAARGTTTVNQIHHIERGYENFDAVLRSLGADIKKA
jgi:UDP-N-acetylglucosamine 1-carboxyvinyltransferase